MTLTDTQYPIVSTIDLSIAIVSYNTKEVLLDCVRSVHAHTIGITFEVIVDRKSVV